MSTTASQELFAIFNARRVKAPDLRGLDAMANGVKGWLRNHRPILRRLRKAAQRVEFLEGEIHALSATRFREEAQSLRELAAVGKLQGPSLDRALAVAREAVVRGIGLRPFPVQIMAALAMHEGAIIELATGEGKTLTGAMTAALWAWAGRPVHIITVNDYLVQRDAHEMGPIYKLLGLDVGFIVHETTPQERIDHYRRGVVYCTQKELVADFLRDQIMLGNLRTASQTSVMMLGGLRSAALQVPGLFRCIVDEADSVLIDEAVTPLIISNNPDDEPNAALYAEANRLARQLEAGRDFHIDRTVRQCELTGRGQRRLEELAAGSGFWRGKRRREELVGQALTAHWCFHRDEQYLVDQDGKVLIIDEFTGRIMADRSWRHGLHQAIEVKENVKITADKENLARLSFQRFFRQYPMLAGMTGTAWESAPEIWQIYGRPVVRIPTNKPCIRKHLRTRLYPTIEHKWQAVTQRIQQLHDREIPILVGTRSVAASEELSRRLTALNIAHRVLNATQTAQEANIVAQAGQRGAITVATNMAGRGTDIKLARGVAELGGLHVIATEPHGSGRVDRQLFGRAGRQGDPGCAQMYSSIEDDLFVRHARHLRTVWRAVGARALIRHAQANAERIARFNRKQVLRADDWMDESLPF
jgi:preprotein translocase subunit SecA